jgi:hypothetical protein
MLWQPAAFVLRASPAALVLFASFARASPCLSSAAAVRQEHPGSWPSWTLRAEGHEGVKCWFPTASAPGRDQTTRQIGPAETATAVRAGTPSTRGPGTSAALLATNGIGRSRETLSPQAPYPPLKGCSSIDSSMKRVISRARPTTSRQSNVLVKPRRGSVQPCRISALVESIPSSAAEPVQGPLLRSSCTGQWNTRSLEISV